MDWLNIFKSRTYGRLRFSVYVLTILTSLIASYYLLCFLSSFVDVVSVGDGLPEAVDIFIVGVLSWWIYQVFIPAILDIMKEIASLSPFSRILYLLPKHDLSNLIWHGDVSVIDSVNLRVTESGRGALFKNIYWKNFLATFNFKFENVFPVRRGLKDEDKTANPQENFIGFVFRAQNLDNYLMLQLGLEVDDMGRKAVFFRPHVRMNGEWEATTHKFRNHPFYTDMFNKVKCIVRDAKMVVELNGKVLDEWDLPSHFRSTVRPEKEEGGYTFGDTSTISFRNNHGMIGFRASGKENVVIKDIKVVQL